MANPNIVNVSSILGKTSFLALTTGDQTLVAGAANKILKINSVYASNITGSNTHDVTVWVRRSSVDYYLSFTVSVPGDATLIVISKDTSVYLEENDLLMAKASSNSVLHAIASYEEIS